MGCYGQDWASYQSPAPNVTGLSFVFVKRTEGLTYVNPRGAAQVAYARLHKLVVGHYHYPHMGNDPAAEAAFFLKTAQPEPGDILVLDWEGYDVANRSVPWSTQVAYKVAFLAALKAAQPALQRLTYCNTDYLSRDPQGEYGDGLWIATGNVAAGQPGISHEWLIHQYSTAGGIDRDFCTLDADALRAWANKEEDMPLTEADAALNANTLLAVKKDDPTTSDNSVKPLGNIWWDTGMNAFQANSGVKQLRADVAALAAKMNTLAVGGVDLDALAAKVADLLAKRLQS